MTAYLILALIILGAALYLVARAYLSERKRRKVAETNVEAARSELIAREEDRHALEQDLARLRAGGADERLDASLNVLRGISATKAHAASDSVARSTPPARDGD